VDAPEEDPRIGERLGGCVLEERLVGLPGGPAVYRGRADGGGGVRVEVVAPSVDDAAAARWRGTLEALVGVEGPGLLGVRSVGQAGDGASYAVLAGHGPTLADEPAGPDLPAVGELVGDLAAGLAAARERGVVHGAIEPVAVVRDVAGQVRLAGFGAAGVGAGAEAVLAGVPGARADGAAPEVVLGAEPDDRADVYALGVLAYRHLAGAPPFRGGDPLASLVARIERLPPLLTFADGAPPPPGLAEVLAWALAPRAPQRVPSAEALAAALAAPANAPARQPSPPAPPRPVASLAELEPADLRPRSGGSARLLWGSALGLTLVALAGAVGFAALPPARADPAVLVPAPSAPGAGGGPDGVVDPRALEAAEALLVAGDPGAALEELEAAAGADAPSVVVLRARAEDALAAAGVAWIPPGLSPPEDGGGVDVAGFYLELTEVTQADYARYAEAARVRPPWGDGPPPRPEAPVGGLSYLAMQAYAGWKGRRLPTAAEWARAARGPTARTFPWGDDPDPRACRCGEPAAGPAPVGSHPRDRSPFGCLDMAGNVAEVTLDPDWSPDTPVLWVRGGAFATRRVVNARPGFRRAWVDPWRRHPAVGFRCAADALPLRLVEER